ncbi:MAG: VCBS repeat-containing protein [Pseudomonadota bacterium]
MRKISCDTGNERLRVGLFVIVITTGKCVAASDAESLNSATPLSSACAVEAVAMSHPLATKAAEFPTFGADLSHAIPHIPFQICDTTTADLNQDGRADFLVANHLEPGFGFFPNQADTNSDQIFAEGVGVPFIRGANSAGVVAADFNGDGFPDVANSDHPGSVTVRINGVNAKGGDISFPDGGETNISLEVTFGDDFGIAGTEGGLVAADFNGDGKIDIATANLGKTRTAQQGYSDHCDAGDRQASFNSASVLINTTPVGADAATFAPGVHFPIPGPSISIASADFNFDGKPDVVTSNTAVSSLSVLTNATEEGSRHPCFSASITLAIDAPDSMPQGAGPTNPLAMDFNGDGKPDIASANWNTHTVTVWINLTPDDDKGKQPTFSATPFSLSTGDTPPLVVRGADLNDDGLNDLVVMPLSPLSTTAMMVLRNTTQQGVNAASFVIDQAYSIPQPLRSSWLHTYFAISGIVQDLDGDGLEEIAVPVVRGSALLKLMKPGNDILKYVDPSVPNWLIHPLLPNRTSLFINKQQSPFPVTPDTGACFTTDSIAVAETTTQDAGVCDLARDILSNLPQQLLSLGRNAVKAGTPDNEIRSQQARFSASRLAALAAGAPPAIQADLQKLSDYMQEASQKVLSTPSWHVPGEIKTAINDVTLYLEARCL